MKKGVLRNFAKFSGKHLCQSLFFNKVAGAATEHVWATELLLSFSFFYKVFAINGNLLNDESYSACQFISKTFSVIKVGFH